MIDLSKRITELEKENDDLKDKLLDVTTELNYSKERELLEFVRGLYQSVNALINKDKDEKDIDVNDLLKNLKLNIEKLSRSYNIDIRR